MYLLKYDMIGTGSIGTQAVSCWWWGRRASRAGTIRPTATGWRWGRRLLDLGDVWGAAVSGGFSIGIRMPSPDMDGDYIW